MKKNISVVVTLILGIALGGGCVFLLLGRGNPPPIPGDRSQDRGSTLRDDTDSALAVGGFTVTTGAAPGYIEDKACAKCHQTLFDAYQQVGMARSFSRPSADNIVEDFQNNHFLHKPSQRHYEMRQQGDGIVFRRYQLDEAGEPINEFERQVDWILGSGNHARNYLYQTEVGEIYQFPVAWYADEQRWGMAATFDAPVHEGVHRAISRECMFCHNAYPDVPAGSDAYPLPNQFPHTLPQGIGCQRCHGPGAEHVRIATLKTSSAEQKRNSIVNPATLSPQLRDDVCNQCHLQPTSASEGMRQFGRADYSFRPGQPLSEYLVDLDVVEEGRKPEERFEINHHAYRLRQSRCFLESPGKLSCLTCHDAHHQIPQAGRAQHYAAACAQCHQPNDCTLEPGSSAHPPGIDPQDCATCHMPRRRTQDVVHVVMTDHLIRKTPADETLLAPIPETRRKLLELLVEMPDAKAGDDAYEMVHSAAMLRLSRYSLPQPMTTLENVLASAEPPVVEPFLDLTMAQLKQHRFAAAERTATLALRRSPDHPLAIEWQGTALLSLRKGDAAVERLEKALSIAPNRAETHFNFGLLLLGQDKIAEANQRFQRALELRPNMVTAAYYLGVTCEQLNQPEDAVRAYERTLEIEPAFARAYLNLGKLLLAQDRREDARRYLRRGIQNVTDTKPLIELFQEAEFAEVTPILSEEVTGTQLPPVSALLVAVPIPNLEGLEPSVATQIQNFLTAFSELTSGDTVSSKHVAEGYGMLGQLYHAYEFNEAAERCYVNAIRLAPQDYRSYHLLGALYQHVGELAAAESYWKSAIKLQPDDVAAVIQLGNINLQLNQPERASEYFRAARDAQPDSPAAHNGLGEVAMAEKQFAEAITHFETVLRLVPDANRIHYSMGMAYRGLGELEKAQAELDKRGPVGIRPADPLVDALPQLLQGEHVHLIRGQLAYSAGRYAEAADAYAKALEANPDSVSALTNYGATLTKGGQLQEAETHLRRAVALDPKNLVANYNLASVLANLEDFEEAVKHFDAVLESTPEDRTVRRLRAGVLRQAARLDEALESLEQLLAEDADDELTLIDLTDLLVERREYGRAIELLSKAIEKFPDRGLTSRSLAQLLATCPDLALRNGTKAVELASIVAKTKQTPQHLETLALALAEAGRCDEAARIQQQLVQVAEEIGNETLATRLKRELVRYQAGSPCRPASEDVSEKNATSKKADSKKADGKKADGKKADNDTSSSNKVSGDKPVNDKETDDLEPTARIKSAGTRTRPVRMGGKPP